MKRRATSSREALLCQLLERAESKGGEEWLLRCLEEGTSVQPTLSPPVQRKGSAAAGSAAKQKPGRKKKVQSAAPSPQSGLKKEVAVTRSASRQRESSATHLMQVEESEQPVSQVGEKSYPDMSQLSVLVNSLSNVLQQFQGAHVSGADRGIQGAQGSGAYGDRNLYSNYAIGTEQQSQSEAECQRAHLSGADFLHETSNDFTPHDMQYLEDVNAIWQESSSHALQDTRKPKGLINAINPSLPIRPSAVTVGESSFKEPLPCVLSPLGFHLPRTVKEKIWRGEFIDLLSLLPSSKEFLSKADKPAGDRSEEDRRRAVPRTSQNWLQAFCIYAAVMGERFPSKCSGLFQHLDIIAEAFRHFGGSSWFS